jgi:membrane-associated phospholipid phosphatase
LIYGPPLILYRRARVGFHQTVLAFTLAMAITFTIFTVFPVEGPRYVWPGPPGIPTGYARRFALTLLEAGSARGTAFPSSHVAIALAIALSSLEWNKRLGLVALIVSGLLTVGAVYGGFHYATDVIVGGLVGVASWYVARTWARSARFNIRPESG